MKKFFKLIFISLCLCVFCVAPNAAFAVEPYEDVDGDICATTGINDPLLCSNKTTNEENSIMNTVGNVLNAIYGVIAVVAVVMIVIAGIKYSTSQGDPGKVQSAKNTIMYSIIGLVITISAFAITAFILSALGGGSAGGGGGGGGGAGGGGGGGGSGAEEVTFLEVTSAKKAYEGEKVQIKVRISPDYAVDRTLTFSSSDQGIATISSSGEISAIKAGTTQITVTASNGVSTEFTFTVEKLIEVESVKIDPATATIKIGKTTTLKATVSPDNAADKSLTWTSSDTKIASITKAGVVKGIKEGTVTITATAKNGKKGTATVTVEPNQKKIPSVFDIYNYKHSNGHNLDYVLSVPEDAHTGMPLVVFLHGDGEVNNPNAVKNLKPVQHMHASNKYITLAPVTKTTDWSSGYIQAALKGLIDKYISEYKIDTKRIYIMGFSRGAIGTWTFVNSNPSLFAAAIPVSCCGGISGTNFKTTKVYALAGGYENNYIGCMKSNVNAINAAGGSAIFETVPGQTHSTITGAFPYSKVLDEWMLKQSK